MATTTTFGSLSVPAPDDTMEMSSPANRNLDDDIDIDFEDYQGGVDLIDDEQMLEDGDPSRPLTATDDVMEDDMLPGEQVTADEEIMRDDIPQIQEVQQQEDEELIDYGEDDFEDQVVDSTVPQVVEQPADVEEIGFEQVDEEIPAAFDGVAIEAPVTLFQEEVAGVEVPQDEPSGEATNLADGLATGAAHDDLADLTETQAPVPEADADANDFTKHPVAESSTHTKVRESNPVNFPPLLDTAVSTSTDTPGTPTDTGLHPMTISFADLLLPLFKSKRQPDGLLKDDNLANLSLAELITNCRQRLALKTGENVSDDQELVLGFDHMGLMLVEVCQAVNPLEKASANIHQDCRAAFESSLHDVLEVYLQLHENDGYEEIPPLSLTLTTQLKFQTSFTMLKQAAAGGQGMSNFSFLHWKAGHQQDFHEEGFEDNGHEEPRAHDEFDGYDFDFASAAPVSVEQQAHTDIEGQPEEPHGYTGEQGEDGQEDYYEEDEYAGQPGDEEYHLPEHSEAAAQLDEFDAGDSFTDEALAQTVDGPDDTTREVKAPGLKTVSTASSTTIYGDSNNNSAGEYDDDLIDWDDDSLTTTFSDQDTSNQEDFSTFLTELDEADTKDHLHGDGATDRLKDSRTAHDTAKGIPADGPLGFDEFLNDPTDQSYEDAAYHGEHEATADGEEYNYDQADTYNEQYDDYHQDCQPGEEDEQYHTAHDLLNADQYEHGPEHDVDDDEGDGLDDTVGTVIHHETADHQDQQEDFEDEIGFDDDDTSYLQDTATTTKLGSPNGKRSFDELKNLEDEDDREAKKARPS